MEILYKILENTSLWEVLALIVVIYLMFRPDIINRITKFKVGELEFELSEIKKEVEHGKQRIAELQREIENEKQQFQELLGRFDANAPLEELASIRQEIKSQSRATADWEIYKKYLNASASHEELYAAAVSIREKRPVELLPDIITLLDQLAKKDDLGGYRLNTIWTLTSAVHKILISCVRDNVHPAPTQQLLESAELMLRRLEQNPRIQADRPDDPMRGVRGPIKHSLEWIRKARASS